MLVLTFQIGGERLALDIRSVKEVVPRVRLERPAGAPDWLAGVFVYRGRIIPVLDLHRLVGSGECPPHLSSRIILVPSGDGEQLVGLLAAQVADLREVDASARPLTGFTAAGRVDLGPVLADGGGVLRLLDLDRLLADPIRRQLDRLPQESP
jgi:chemotaxis-related protein WspB